MHQKTGCLTFQDLCHPAKDKVVLREIILYYKMVLVYTMPRLILALMHCKAKTWNSFIFDKRERNQFPLKRHRSQEMIYSPYFDGSIIVILTKQSSTF